MAKWIRQWLPATLIMGAIFYFSSIPSIEMPNFGSWDTLVKKSGHMLGYALLGVAYLRGTQSYRWQSILAAMAGVVVYALSDEYHQSFVAGRTSTLVDVGIDTIGAIVGQSIVWLIPSLRKLIFQDWNLPGKTSEPK
jgi:VanZ family protein